MGTHGCHNISDGGRKLQSLIFGVLSFLGILTFAANSAHSFEFPLSPMERTSMLKGVAQGSEVWPALYRYNVQPLANTSLPSDQRARYLAAGLGERVSIAQQIGEEGVERYAARHRLKTLLSPRGLRSPTGPDSVYINRNTGRIIVLEAKGGTSALKWTYGTLQGINSNTIQSARGVLLRSGTTRTEKLAAARVIRAAQDGRLETRVIRTRHVVGVPRSPIPYGNPSLANVVNQARLFERDLVRQHPALRSVFRQAGNQAAIGRIWNTGSRVMLPVAVVTSGAALGIGAYRVVKGEIGSTEFFRNNKDPIIFISFTTSGAIIGGIASLGVGAVAGAAIGGLIALPAQLAYDVFENIRHRKFKEEQFVAIDRVIEKVYLGKAATQL